MTLERNNIKERVIITWRGRESKEKMKWSVYWVGLVIIMVAATVAADSTGGSVTYDGRSLIINGKRSILFSGSIHYPRSTPDVRIQEGTFEL